jgi:hypothetical protein
MDQENQYFFLSFNPEENRDHPQMGILKIHIERAVQDLFLDSLRTQAPELLYVFSSEDQIDGFVKKILTYWEELENYEICQEVLSLAKEFKEKWKNRDMDESSVGLLRIKDLFKSSQG